MNRAERREAERQARKDVRDPTHAHLRLLADPAYAGVGMDEATVAEPIWISAFVEAFAHAETPSALFGFVWDAVVATWGLSFGVETRVAWARRWEEATRAEGPHQACSRMLAELRARYGGAPVSS